MKIWTVSGSFACCALQLVSCREDVRPDASDYEATALTEDSADRSSDEINKQFDEWRRSHDREIFYFDSLFAQFVGIPDDIAAKVNRKPVVTDAFILSVGEDGKIKTLEQICGREADTYGDFIPPDAAPGRYLAGRLMPYGGWSLGGRRGGGVFCCPILSDDTFSYGFEGELVGHIESVRKLKITSANKAEMATPRKPSDQIGR